MLLAFVEKLGHEYEPLLKDAIDDELLIMNENNEILLAAAIHQMKTTAEKKSIQMRMTWKMSQKTIQRMILSWVSLKGVLTFLFIF